MSTFMEYIDWRGDLPFARDPFNEVDNLIFSQLIYADFGGIVPPPGEEGSVTLREASEQYDAEGRDQSFMLNDPKPLLMHAAESERFGKVKLSAFADEIDTEKQLQFAAVTFELDDGTVFVAYRGTDNTIVGWREDFNISVLTEIPAQSRAASYLNETASRFDGLIRVGGHSKGGNLAFYAAAFCDSSVKSRIYSVYSNDGPGFRREVTERALYREIFPKLRKIVPESSIIGLLLAAGEQRMVVKSSAESVQQHNPYSWQVQGNQFVHVEKLGTMSTMLEEALDDWVSALNDEQRKNLVSVIFDSLEAAGTVTLTEFNAHKRESYNAVLKAVRELDPELQKDVLETMKKFAIAGKNVLWDEAKRSFEEFIGGGEE